MLDLKVFQLRLRADSPSRFFLGTAQTIPFQADDSLMVSHTITAEREVFLTHVHRMYLFNNFDYSTRERKSTIRVGKANPSYCYHEYCYCDFTTRSKI